MIAKVSITISRDQLACKDFSPASTKMLEGLETEEGNYNSYYQPIIEMLARMAKEFKMAG